MKRIAYIELDTHPEILSNFMELMNDSKEFRVDYYISNKIDRLRFAENSNIKIVTAETILNQMKEHEYDLVLIGTIHRYFSTFKEIIQRYKTTAIVHNLNFSKTSKFQLIQNIWKEDIVFRLKLFLKEGLLSVPKVYQSLAHILVLDESFVRNKEVYLPIFYSSKNELSVSDDVLKIVIPGTVSQHRRDYEKVLKKLHQFKSNIQVVFLGKAQGLELDWLENAKSTLPKNVDIIYFKEKLSGENFSKYMINANVLWCPIQSKTQFMSVEEFYGKTKMSGNIGDAIKYGKPAIFPSTYQSKFPFIISEEIDVESQLLNVSKQCFDFEILEKRKVLLQLEEVLRKLI